MKISTFDIAVFVAPVWSINTATPTSTRADPAGIVRSTACHVQLGLVCAFVRLLIAEHDIGPSVLYIEYTRNFQFKTQVDTRHLTVYNSGHDKVIRCSLETGSVYQRQDAFPQTWQDRQRASWNVSILRQTLMI